jgi:succinate dehydrogenase cytochrome b556 subunit
MDKKKDMKDMKDMNNKPVVGVQSTRPVSPYLSVYRLQASSFFSIFTRMTGVVLLVGLTLPILLLSHADLGMTNYFWYSLMFFFFKSSYSSLAFSGLFLSFILSLLFHVVAVIRNVLSRTFWPTPYQKELVYDPVQFFIFVPIGLFVPACFVYFVI